MSSLRSDSAHDRLPEKSNSPSPAPAVASSATSRRRFLALGAAAFSAPMILPRRVFGANDRVVTAHIGMGGQGRGNMRAYIQNAAALVDVDAKHLATAAKMLEEAGGRRADTYEDYRRVLDRDDIDAVVISTPDHWHALPTIQACRAGKDVYCEKPLSLTVAEGRQMVQAARENNRVVQTGSQQRSDDKFRLGCQLVRSGRIGKIREVHVGIAASNHPFTKRGPVADSEPPSELNYDAWLGPAPWRPYNVDRVHYNFRFFWDYSGGQMTNWGAHHLDIAHWGLGVDDSGPLEVEGTAEFHPQGWIDVPLVSRITYRYPDDVTVIVGQEQKDIKMGTRFIGEEGEIFVNRGVIESTPEEIVADAQKPGGADDLVELYRSRNHHRNFLECVATREKPICDVEIGHRSSVACHLGNLTVRVGRKLRWDAQSERIIGDDEASEMLSRPDREPWVLG